MHVALLVKCELTRSHSIKVPLAAFVATERVSASERWAGVVWTVQSVVHGVGGAVAVALGDGAESLGIERASVEVTLRGRVVVGAVREWYIGRR